MGKLEWCLDWFVGGPDSVNTGSKWYHYHDGSVVYATVIRLPLVEGGDKNRWYWRSGWDCGIPYKTTRDSPYDTPEEAKEQAKKYVMEQLSKNDGGNHG